MKTAYNYLLISLISIFPAFFTGTVTANKLPDVLIQGKIDRNRITIGDKFNYELKYNYSNDIKFFIPPPGAHLGVFEIKDFQVKPIKKSGGIFSPHRNIAEQKFVLSTFTTGQYVIPSMTIEYLDVSDSTKTVSTGEIYILVESVIDKEGLEDDIRDIKPPVNIPMGKIWKILFSIIPLLTLILLFWYFYYNRPVIQNIIEETTPGLPPHELALSQLRKLNESDLLSTGNYRQYYTLLSDIIRKYIEGRYNIAAIERTTWEIFQELRAVDKKYCSKYKELLDDCDLVKFAKYIPDGDIVNTDYNTAVSLVENTKHGVPI